MKWRETRGVDLSVNFTLKSTQLTQSHAKIREELAHLLCNSDLASRAEIWFVDHMLTTFEFIPCRLPITKRENVCNVGYGHVLAYQRSNLAPSRRWPSNACHTSHTHHARHKVYPRYAPRVSRARRGDARSITRINFVTCMVSV